MLGARAARRECSEAADDQVRRAAFPAESPTVRSAYGTGKLPPETKNIASFTTCVTWKQAPGQTLTADGYPQGHRREQAMILVGPAVVVAALVTLAVPCIRGTLMVRDARRRAGSLTPRPQ